MAMNDRFRATIVGSLHGQTINTVLFYIQSFDNGVTSTPEIGLAAQVGILASGLLAEQSVEYTYLQTVVQRFVPVPPRVPIVDASLTGTGSITGDSLPCYCCATITKQTNFAGPRYRGRIYLAGIPVSSELDSQLKSARRLALQTLAAPFASILTDLNGDQFTPILEHRNPVPDFYTVLRSMRVNPVLRSQRRREIGKGV